MKKKHFVHGGDVQAITVDSLPSKAVKIDHKPIALGEKSGHMHIATGDVSLYEEDGRIYAVVGERGGNLQHVHESIFNNDYNTDKIISKADHKPVTLKPNSTYMFGIHKRYNPLEKFWEKAKD
jgi:hypothetical protein